MVYTSNVEFKGTSVFRHFDENRILLNFENPIFRKMVKISIFGKKWYFVKK